ncbi:MAG TPA: GNAT family N-acetyltransferase [Polyangiaceae bacterium]|jgi:amino-acid N-acetyltransferase
MSKPPPQRVRVTRLQEAQIDAVVAIDRACKEAAHRAGVPAADWPVRGLAGMAALTKMHNVVAAEADGVVAGFAAWRDESPGVAILEDVAVAPDMQRLGVGKRLFEAVLEEARAVSLPVLLARPWDKVPSGRAFLVKAGMVPIEKLEASERVQMWREEHESAGGVLKPGQALLGQSLL